MSELRSLESLAVQAASVSEIFCGRNSLNHPSLAAEHSRILSKKGQALWYDGDAVGQEWRGARVEESGGERTRTPSPPAPTTAWCPPTNLRSVPGEGRKACPLSPCPPCPLSPAPCPLPITASLDNPISKNNRQKNLKNRGENDPHEMFGQKDPRKPERHADRCFGNIQKTPRKRSICRTVHCLLPTACYPPVPEPSAGSLATCPLLH